MQFGKLRKDKTQFQLSSVPVIVYTNWIIHVNGNIVNSRLICS